MQGGQNLGRPHGLTIAKYCPEVAQKRTPRLGWPPKASETRETAEARARSGQFSGRIGHGQEGFPDIRVAVRNAIGHRRVRVQHDLDLVRPRRQAVPYGVALRGMYTASIRFDLFSCSRGAFG